MEPWLIGVISVSVLLLLIFLGVHIAIAMGVVAFGGLLLLTTLKASLTVAAQAFYTTASTYSFAVIPLFIIMGHFASAAGVMEKAYNFASKWFSALPAGLYIVTIASCAMFATVTGSNTATAIAVGKSVLPEMKKRGYDTKLSMGCVAAAGTLGIMIPPSVPFVLYGIATDEPIGKLLLSGILPGILSAVVYMIGIAIMARLNPSIAPAPVHYTWNERFKAIPGIWGVAVLFGLVMGGIYGGIFTPNEAAAWGAFAAILLLVIKSRKRFVTEAMKAGWDTAMTTAMIFFLIITSLMLSRFLTIAGVVDAMVTFVTQSGFSPYMVLVWFIVIWIILGMFLSASAVLLLIAPISHAALVPLGFDGIWLGVITIKMFELAAITPPVGINVYVVKGLDHKIPLADVFRGVNAFVAMELITVVILVVFPQISIWLPNTALGT